MKVAWAIRVSPLGERATHLELEVRVSATDDAAWRRFRRYFRLIGPASRFIRRSLLRALARELGRPEPDEDERRWPATSCSPTRRAADPRHRHRRDARGDLALARPDGMPARRLLQHRRARQWRPPQRARDPPRLQGLAVGHVIPATPGRRRRLRGARASRRRARWCSAGCSTRALERQLPFAAPRPERFWHVTWAFVLEPLDGRSTRLHVRVRGAFAASERLRARAGCQPVHRLMESRAAAAPGRPRRGPAAARRLARRRSRASAARRGWRAASPHAVPARTPRAAGGSTAGRGAPAARRRARPDAALELDARRRDRRPAGGGVAVGGADRRRPRRLLQLPVAREPGRVPASGTPSGSIPNGRCGPGDGSCCTRPSAAADRRRRAAAASSSPTRRPTRHAVAAGEPWVAASWLFLVEPLDAGRSRFVSRYRVACSDDLRTRLAFGPALVEPIGFEMDRRMLLGVKARAERRPPMDAARR